MINEEREELEKLYPGCTDEELEKIEEALDQYLEIVWEIADPEKSEANGPES